VRLYDYALNVLPIAVAWGFLDWNVIRWKSPSKGERCASPESFKSFVVSSQKNKKKELAIHLAAPFLNFPD
jgi:hypothetical protein